MNSDTNKLMSSYMAGEEVKGRFTLMQGSESPGGDTARCQSTNVAQVQGKQRVGEMAWFLVSIHSPGSVIKYSQESSPTVTVTQN